MRSLIIFFSLLPLICSGQQPELVVPIGHTGGLREATFSPDGKMILTHAHESMAILWDVYGNELKSFQLTKGRFIDSAIFSSDGNFVLIRFLEETYTAESIYGVRIWWINGEPLSAIEEVSENTIHAVFGRGGQSVVTADSEGFIKEWDFNGNQMTVLKAGDGSIASMTLSPDGTYIVTAVIDEETGGFLGKFWDFKNGKLIKEIGVFSYISFAPNSRYLLYSHNKSTKLVNSKGELIKTFEEYGSFSPNSRFINFHTAYGQISSWDMETNTLNQYEPGITIAFSENGQFKLQGGKENDKVELLNLRTQETRIFTGFTNGVDELKFSSDGNFFLTVEENKDYTITLSLYNLEGDQSLRASRILSDFYHEDVIGFFSDDPCILTMNSKRDFVIWNNKLETTGILKGHTGELSDVFFSEDNESLVLSTSLAQKKWDLQSNNISVSMEEKPFYTGYNGDVLWSPDREFTFGADAGGFVPALYSNTDKAMDPLVVKEGGFEGHTAPIYAAAFSQDGQYILTGSNDGTARLWNLSGDNLQTYGDHDHVVWSVGFSADNQLLLTATDKMIKLWRPDSPEEIASLILIDSTDWIVTTSSGLFDASPNAMRLMHYSLFYERDQEYIVIDVEQLKSRYYEPGLLQKLLGYVDETIRPVGDFTNVALYPKVNANIDTLSSTLNISLHERNGGIGKVSIFINGKEVVEEANPLPRRENAQRDSVLQFDLNQYQNFLLRHPDSTNIISIRAYNEEGWLKSRTVNLEYNIPAARARGENSDNTGAWVGEFSPKLYIISIGTSNYSGSKLDLQYADQDATMMAKALQSVGAALFTNGDSLEVHCLSTASVDSTGLEETPIHWQFANKKNISATFEEIKSKAKAEDVIVVYLSGHGVTQSGQDRTQFYYLTQGVTSPDDLADPATLRAYTISSEELTKWINDIPALKQVLIIDACNSGQIVEELTGGTKSLNSSQIRALDRMKDRTGMFVLSGSASDKVSYEAGEYGQGLLTYALLQGMLGVATRKDNEGQKIVDVMKLFQYARDEVPRMAASINGVQTPMLGFPSRAASFDIGMVNDNTVIPIGNKKPVVIRNTFLNAISLRDDLQLADLLENALREETEEGTRADLIYVDVYDYPNAYSLGGLYESTAEGIRLTANLFKGDDLIKALEIPPVEDVGKLVKYLMRAVKKTIRENNE